MPPLQNSNQEAQPSYHGTFSQIKLNHNVNTTPLVSDDGFLPFTKGKITNHFALFKSIAPVSPTLTAIMVSSNNTVVTYYKKTSPLVLETKFSKTFIPSSLIV